MAGRGDALRRCWVNGRLRRALAAYLLFNINEWASWIALLVWAYAAHGVRGASLIAVVMLVPAALLASVAATWLGGLPTPKALRLGYLAQAVTTTAAGVVVLLDAPFAVVCVFGAAGAVAITFTRPVHNALLPEVSDTTSELTAGNAGSGSVEAAATFLGPLVSGSLALWWDPGGVLVAMGVGAVLSALCTIGLGPGAPRVGLAEGEHGVDGDARGAPRPGRPAAELDRRGRVRAPRHARHPARRAGPGHARDVGRRSGPAELRRRRRRAWWGPC